MFCCAGILAKKENNHDSLLPNFLLLWLYPIALWIIQPRIRAVFNNKDSKSTTLANQ